MLQYLGEQRSFFARRDTIRNAQLDLICSLTAFYEPAFQMTCCTMKPSIEAPRLLPSLLNALLTVVLQNTVLNVVALQRFNLRVMGPSMLGPSVNSASHAGRVRTARRVTTTPEIEPADCAGPAFPAPSLCVPSAPACTHKRSSSLPRFLSPSFAFFPLSRRQLPAALRRRPSYSRHHWRGGSSCAPYADSGSDSVAVPQDRPLSSYRKTPNAALMTENGVKDFVYCLRSPEQKRTWRWADKAVA